MKNLTRWSSAFLCTAGICMPQEQSKGPMVGFAAVVSVDAKTQTLRSAELYFKDAGYSNAPIQGRGELAGRGKPIFTAQALGLTNQTGLGWTQRQTSVAPPARWMSKMAFNGTDSILVGGFPTATETWKFDGTNWSRLANMPSPKAMHAVAALDGAVYAFGGQPSNGSMIRLASSGVWETRTGSTPRSHSAMVPFDGKQLIVFGGLRHGLVFLDDTLRYDAVADRWQPLMSPHKPPARAGHAMAYDPVRKVIVMFGGFNLSGKLSDTWEWDGMGWSPKATSGPNPGPRHYHEMAFVDGKVLLFGGIRGAGLPDCTWEWDGSTWKALQGTGPGRIWHAMSYDSVRKRLVVFGGSKTVVPLGDTWVGELGADLPIDIDAMSVGLDYIPALPNGIVNITEKEGWVALVLSVAREARGAEGSPIRTEVDGNGASSDGFSYVLTGSRCIAADLINIPQKASDSSEFGIKTSYAANVDAMDAFIPAYAMQPTHVALPIPEKPTFYFSVSKETRCNLPVSWWAGTNPSGATILSAKWTPGDQGPGAWSGHGVFQRYDELGMPEDGDVDALAVSSVGDPKQELTPQYMLFSPRKPLPPGFGQLMFASNLEDAAAVTRYRYSNEVDDEIDKKLKLELQDEIDGVCEVDPCNASRVIMERMMGSQVTDGLALPGPRLVSGAIRMPTVGGQKLRTFVSGGPRPAASGLFIFPAVAFAPFLFVLTPTGGNPFPGDPTILDLPLPPTLSVTSARLLWAELRSPFSDSRFGRMLTIKL